MKRAALVGLPSSLDPYLRIFFTIYAFGLIAYGWIFVAFLTVAIVNALLRHYTGRWINF